MLSRRVRGPLVSIDKIDYELLIVSLLPKMFNLDQDEIKFTVFFYDSLVQNSNGPFKERPVGGPVFDSIDDMRYGERF